MKPLKACVSGVVLVTTVLMASQTTAVAQGTRSSGIQDPLYAIANGLDPLTNQPAATPFTAPTTFATAVQPVATAPSSFGNAQQIFISDADLAATSGFDVPAGFGSASFGAAASTGTSAFGTTGFGTPGADAGIGFVSTGSNGTNYFISDGDIGGFGGGQAAFGAFDSTGAIVGRLPGDLPIVGPEYSNEIPGMGLSVVQPIQTVSAAEATVIADTLAASAQTTFATSALAGGVSAGGSGVAATLPSPRTRPSRHPVRIAGNVAACQLDRQGHRYLDVACEVASNRPGADGTSGLTPSTDTSNINTFTQDGGVVSGTTVQPLTTTPVEQPTSQPAAPAATPAPTPTPTQVAQSSSGTCRGPLVLQFNDDAKELTAAHEQQLRALVLACRQNQPDAVFSVLAYPDQAQAGNAAARSTPGARLFDLRFEMVASGVAATNLVLRPETERTDYNNALVVNIE